MAVAAQTGVSVYAIQSKGGLAAVEAHGSKQAARITGANQGIGFEIVRQLEKQGLIVTGNGRDKRGLKAPVSRKKDFHRGHDNFCDAAGV